MRPEASAANLDSNATVSGGVGTKERKKKVPVVARDTSMFHKKKKAAPSAVEEESIGGEETPFDPASEGASSSSLLLVCDECRYTTESEVRFKLHFQEPRHVNHFRSMAYRDPKKRQMWLKIWFSTLEKAEAANGDAFEVDEAEEDEFHARLNRAGSGRRRGSVAFASSVTTVTSTLVVDHYRS